MDGVDLASRFIHNGHAFVASGTGVSTRALALAMSFCAWYHAHAAKLTPYIFHLTWIHNAGVESL